MSQRLPASAFVSTAAAVVVAAASSAQQPPPPPAPTVVTGVRLVPTSGAPQNPASPTPATPAQPAATVPAAAPTTAPTTATATGNAQDPQPGQQPGATPQPGANAAPQDPAAKAAAEAAAKKAAEEQKKQQRLQKIKQVKFDRRSTTMLRTWSSPATAGVVTADAPQPGQAPEGGEPMAQQEAPAEPGAVVISSGIPSGVQVLSVPASSLVPVPPDAQGTEPPPPPPPEPTAGAPAETAPPTGKEKPKLDPFDQSLKDWSRAVTLGDWPAVKTFLAGLSSDAEKKEAWLHMLNSLRNPPPPQGPQPPVPSPQFFFTFDDVLGLAAAAPIARDDAAFTALGAILQQALQRGLLVEPLLQKLRTETKTTPPAFTAREAIKLLFAANLRIEAGEFLPPVATAAKERDFEALNLLAQHLVARNQKEGKAALLEEAWAALQEVFAATDVDKKQKEEALKNAVALAPRLKQELGQSWLDQSFTKDVQRGMDIITSIGIAAADAGRMQIQNADFRKLTLQLQKTAVGALLAAAPERAAQWQNQLAILADNWLREAQTSYSFDQSGNFGPSMRRDRYGNFFYYDYDNGMRQGGQPTAAIPTSDVLELLPNPTWLQALEAGMQPKFAMVTAQLWLKVQEEQQAFPFIKELARTHPPQAKELVSEFLRVWTKNHDPNEGRHNYYFYGYESRADGIPLTRSKQERNLTDLAKWVQELRALPIGEPDQDLLARAFTTCHSSAEVYRLEAIEKVFGPMGGLKPRTLAALLEQMRGNLGTVWRLPATQEKAKTKRKQKDIEAEVERGYQVAQAVALDGLQKHPNDWSLLLARATLLHDENDYRREIGNDVKYAERRGAAFADFAAAAKSYAAAAPKLTREEESIDVYERWFYAALGSSELANIKSEQVPVLAQITAAKDSLAALPGDAAPRHLERFANGLFTKMGNLNPAVKLRYVKAGLDIVGDQKQAFEAKKLYDYYKDIVAEIQLQTRIDGSTTVGHDRPFGVFVEIRHTREIERESGGFGRYLRNQNDVSYSFNYGRPTENYRDKFSDMARQQLGEHFEVMSVTFQQDTVHSRATDEYGWRVTPYAYLLLKPRGPQIDRLPSLRLDLDFLDTSGYAVLPIESPALAIDSSAASAPPRPCDKIEITQILDERQAKDGKLMLEVKATAHGLLPSFEELVDLKPEGFDVAAVDDAGASVSRFDPDGATDAVCTERTWNVTLRAKKDLAERPRNFTFGTPRKEGIAVVRQRYADADLVAAAPTVELLAEYGTPRAKWPWFLLGGALIALLGGAAFALRRRPNASATGGLQVPSSITPFTVIGLLREIRRLPGIDASAQTEIDTAIADIERGFFAAGSSPQLDLQTMARQWVERAQRRQSAS